MLKILATTQKNGCPRAPGLNSLYFLCVNGDRRIDATT